MSNDSQRAGALDRRAFLQRSGVAAAAVLATAGAKAQQQAEGERMLKVAMLSGWHAHARGYGKALSDMSDVKVTVVWDEEPERGQEWAQELGVPFEPSLEATLARADVDAVAVDAPTNRHAEIMVAAANAGKHIFTEKVMALTIDECNQISDAVRKAGVKFAISFPFRTRPEVLYAQQAIQEGLLGQLTSLRVRVAHNGISAGWLPPHFKDPVPTGGGAMMDLGAHPMYLARWIGGQPKRISSTFNALQAEQVEDNAVSVIEFENKCIGVSETSFVSTLSPFSLELSGTEGSLLVGGLDETAARIRSTKLRGKEWVTPEKLPEPLPSPLRLWIDGILQDKPIPFGLEEGTQLTELMQYAYLSAKERRQVDIPAR